MALRQSMNDMTYRPPPLQVINVSNLCFHFCIHVSCIRYFYFLIQTSSFWISFDHQSVTKSYDKMFLYF